MADESVELELTATDDASATIGKVADALDDLPDDATVDVEADTRDALTAIERFDREVEDLTDDGRELRIEFKAQTLQRQITSALRDLERLDDPTEIDVRTDDLERAQKDLRDLAELADRKYSVDIDADPKRTAQRAAGDLDGIRQKGEGLQSAIPAIRGFGDELGGAAQAAGIGSQAVADLGDFALIAGEQFAGAGSRMQGVATKLGTVLGAAGLAGAIGGIAVQLGQLALPAIKDWIGAADDAVEANADVAKSFDGVGEAIKERNYRQAVDEIIGANDELFDSGRKFGVGTERIVRYLTGLSDELPAANKGVDTAGEAWKQFAADLELSRDVIAGSTADAFNADRWVPGVVAELATAGVATDDYSGRLQAAADALGIVADASGEAESATEEMTDAERDAIAFAEAGVEAITNLADARRASADSYFAVIKSQNDFDDAVADSTEVLDAAAVGSNEYENALIDATQSAADLADSSVRVATDAAAATGKTLAQADATSTWNRQMVAAAKQADGPLRDSIIDYIGTVNGIPPEKVSKILADLDDKSVDFASGRIDDASATRESQIIAEANVSTANGQLDNAARDRTATIYGDVTIRRNVRWDQSSGQFVSTRSAPRSLAAPATTAARGARSGADADLYLSTSPGAARPITTTSTTNNVTVNLPTAADARSVIAAVNRWTRKNGRGALR